MYTVYWYKLPEHTNPFTEGYIGITNDMQRRNNEHLRSKVSTHFTNALSKYTTITYEVLHVTTKEDALLLEYAYRPSTNIGWNSAVGGEDTLKSVRNTPITLYHESNYVIVYTFKSIIEASNTLGIGRERLSQAKLRKTTVYGYDGWAVLHDINHDRSTTITIQQAISNRLKGIPKAYKNVFKGMTNRWSEEDKQRISKQHKGKTISEQQKQTVAAKNRTNSLCKQVTLVHISNPTKEFTYHSLSEASRQLLIPLSRLKSKAQRPLHIHGKDGWAITNLGSE